MKKEKKTKKGLFWMLSISALAVVLVLFCQFYFSDAPMEERFFENTTINGIDVSYLTAEEAENILEYNLLKNREDIELELTAGDKSWNFKGSDFTLVSDIKPAIATVMKKGREGKPLEKIKERNKIKKDGLSYDISYRTVLGGIDSIIDDIALEIEKESVEPTLQFDANSSEPFYVTKAETGIKVNRELLHERIDKGLAESQQVSIDIPLIEVPNIISKEDLLSNVALRSRFSTNYASSKAGRKNNVQKALGAFNGMIVEPQQEVSFNVTTGARTSANGYEEANIIVGGVYVKGAGGGACQASTTLYNALLLADMEILEVNHHSLPASYVPLSCDAMVSEGVADLKFKNPFDYPIYIRTYADEKEVTAEIYGRPFEDGESVKVKSEFIKVLPHGGDQIVPDTTGEFSRYVLYKGEYYRQKYPKEGYESHAYLQRFKDGQLVEEREIRHDFYQPQNGIVIEGTEDIGEGMTLPANAVKIISPQKESVTNNENVRKKLEKDLPSAFNP